MESAEEKQKPSVSDTEIPTTVIGTVASEEPSIQQDFVNRVFEADEDTEVLDDEDDVEDNEKYRLFVMLSQETYGTVYKALGNTGVIYAIKKFHTEKSQFEREVTILKSLSHVNIVKYYEDFTQDLYYFMVMEIQALSLQDLIDGLGVLPEEMVHVYAKQIVAGLCYIHSQGIVHKDIRPSNILVASNGQIKITDFGLCQLENDTHKNNLGTLHYMAPELFSSTPSASTKSDIWALAVTILELLNGYPPYHNLAPDQAQFNIIVNLSPPIPFDITEELQHFLKCCFVQDVSKRAEANKLLQHPWVHINFAE